MGGTIPGRRGIHVNNIFTRNQGMDNSSTIRSCTQNAIQPKFISTNLEQCSQNQKIDECTIKLLSYDGLVKYTMLADVGSRQTQSSGVQDVKQVWGRGAVRRKPRRECRRPR